MREGGRKKKSDASKKGKYNMDSVEKGDVCR